MNCHSPRALHVQNMCTLSKLITTTKATEIFKQQNSITIFLVINPLYRRLELYILSVRLP